MLLESFYIKNFRLFKELTIEKLGRVNLIVGKNNAGKSCLLEALRIYATDADPYFLHKIISDRNEDWELKLYLKMNENENEKQQTLFPPSFQDHPLRHIFHNYRLPIAKQGERMEIGHFKPSDKRIYLYTQSYQIKETEEGIQRKRVELDLINTQLEEIDTFLEVQDQKGTKIPLIHLGKKKSLSVSFVLRHRRMRIKTTVYNVQFLPTTPIDVRETAILWDNINIQPTLRNEVFEALRLFDRDIQEIVFIGRREEIVPLVLYEGEKRLPLKSLGDGISHLFQMILMLLNAKEGLLLIDEFENGLHYTLQPKVWEIIFILAKKLNVQVFATTHSWDCVKAFQQASEQTDEEAMLLRLGRSVRKSDRGQVIATLYDKSSLKTVTQEEMEIR